MRWLSRDDGGHRDQRRDRDAGDRGDRDRRVAQDVPLDHRARDAPADRGLHVLAPAFVADRGPGHPGDDGQRRDRQRDGGQREVPDVARESVPLPRAGNQPS